MKCLYSSTLSPSLAATASVTAGSETVLQSAVLSTPLTSAATCTKQTASATCLYHAASIELFYLFLRDHWLW